jgi:hypothetical protein
MSRNNVQRAVKIMNEKCFCWQWYFTKYACRGINNKKKKRVAIKSNSMQKLLEKVNRRGVYKLSMADDTPVALFCNHGFSRSQGTHAAFCHWGIRPHWP